MDYFCFESVGCADRPIVIDFDKCEKDIAFSIGKSLSEFRKCLKKGQSDMAAYFDVSVSQYRKYEAGIDIPKMHSAARWSAITGAPLPLLFKHTAYARFFPTEELQCRRYFSFVAKSSDREFYSVLSLVSGKSGFGSEMPPHDRELEFELALEDVIHHYYYRVAKNIEAIQHHHQISRSEMSFLLGISSNTYARYITRPNEISIPIVFYARAHAALGIKTSWAETGKTFYALVNKRRKDRTALLENILQHLAPDEANDFLEILCFIGERRAKIQRLQVKLESASLTLENNCKQDAELNSMS
ncbi:helix-turn-helix transcriptional regulator [Jeongeupia chitinilytica]|uniref:HTH cro/C1-type domain-containing protein n=1 Tax=Jeongeupia chitinilytica TaxID=1041641 RepID=A0ABQ3H0V8_9NEIS|nr:helix-turn-helix transcriptional regulator [Jeongeupia chitinilytica]GHD62206.1 hypothetical protein GCM10007350_17810 [Jeongeupia chitinilytica]